MSRRIYYVLGYIAWLCMLGAVDAPLAGIARSAVATGQETVAAAVSAVMATFTVCMLYGLYWYFRRARHLLWGWPAMEALHKQAGTIAKQVEHVYVDALPSLESAVQLTPSDAGAWARLSYALNRAGRSADALTASEWALALDPRFAAAWTCKATVLARLGRAEQGLAACNCALALDVQDASNWVVTASTLEHLHRYSEALDASDHAMTLGLDHAPPWHTALLWQTRAGALQGLGRSAESLQASDRVLDDQPNLAIAWYNRAISLHALGRDVEAKAAVRRAKELCA